MNHGQWLGAITGEEGLNHGDGFRLIMLEGLGESPWTRG